MVDDVLGLHPARGAVASATNPQGYEGPEADGSGEGSPHAARREAAGPMACRVLLGRLVKFTKGAKQ